MWNLKEIDTSKALYVAVADALERDIRSGVLRPGQELPSHRALAKLVGVTVTTASRAYAEAEKRNLINSVVGSGTFVAADAGLHASLVDASGNRKAASGVPESADMGLVHPLYNTEKYLEEVVARVAAGGNLGRYMPYAQPEGHYEHRTAGARWVRRFGVKAAPGNIVIAAGTQHAMHCIFSSVFKPGDHLAVDGLTFPGAKLAARSNGLRLEAVDMDEEGMRPDALEALCRRQPIKGCYSTGFAQNPTNRNSTPERRRELARVIKKYALVLVEDDIHGFLAPEAEHTLTALLPEQGIYLAGLAKAFYSGLRVAFVAAPTRLCGRITQSLVDSIWMTSPLCAAIACEAISGGFADKIMRAKKRELDRRMEIFREEMAGYTFQLGARSMHAWLELPAGWKAAGFARTAEENGLQVYSSEKFTVGPAAPPDCIRLAISGPPDARAFRKALKLLKTLLEQK